ncbi:SPOR domain-containing protein, partial [Pseudomonas aeruginosa]|uniref:SPOR domain-containing protein n=1 Tax=Pseudomonas aeruginosa TaxID=287 RepID=UPI003013D08E
YHPIACDLHDYLEIACLYRYRLLLELEDGVRFERLDANNLPQSWSVQLASLSNRARAEELQKTLRSQGYNAYIRSFDGMNRVFVGPVIQRAEADRLRDQLSKQQKLNGFVVRFQPERG